MTYTTAHVRMPEWSVVNLKNASHEITAELVVPDGGAVGVVACQGGNMAGWSLYLDQTGMPTYLYNCFGHELTSVAGDGPLAPGRHLVKLFHDHDGGFGAGGTMILFVDGVEVASARVERTVPIVFSMSGETFDVGVDTGAPVGPYPHGFRCTADIIGVTLERLTDPDPEVRRAMAEGQFRAAMSSQ